MRKRKVTKTSITASVGLGSSVAEEPPASDPVTSFVNEVRHQAQRAGIHKDHQEYHVYYLGSPPNGVWDIKVGDYWVDHGGEMPDPTYKWTGEEWVRVPGLPDSGDWMSDLPSDQALATLKDKLTGQRIREFDNDLATLPSISVEMWRFEDPSGFIYTDLYPTADWNGSELPLGSGKWHDPQDWAWFDRKVSPVWDRSKHLERRDQMVARGFVWTPWERLPLILQQYITMCVLRPEWNKRFLADQNDSFVLDRVMVYVKGDLW